MACSCARLRTDHPPAFAGGRPRPKSEGFLPHLNFGQFRPIFRGRFTFTSPCCGVSALSCRNWV